MAELCIHEFQVCNEENVKYRCAKCQCSGYRYPQTGVIVPHTHNRPVPTHEPTRVPAQGGWDHGMGHKRLGKRGPGSY